MRQRILIMMSLMWAGGIGVLWAGEPWAPFVKGERIEYSIRKMGVKAGEATLTFGGATQLDGKPAVLIIFKATAINFWDEEKIYIDPQTFLPIRVERDVNLWGKKEKIIENYLPSANGVKITKKAGNKTVEQVISKPGQLDNIYGFIYRYRRDGQFKIGDTLQMALPTQDVKLSLVEKEQLKAGNAVYDTYFMESNPKKYRVWFDSGERRIPLRIDGAVGFGSTSMIIQLYTHPGATASP